MVTVFLIFFLSSEGQIVNSYKNITMPCKQYIKLLLITEHNHILRVYTKLQYKLRTTWSLFICKIPQKTPKCSPKKVSYGVSFVNSKSVLYDTCANVTLYIDCVLQEPAMCCTNIHDITGSCTTLMISDNINSIL